MAKKHYTLSNEAPRSSFRFLHFFGVGLSNHYLSGSGPGGGLPHLSNNEQGPSAHPFQGLSQIGKVYCIHPYLQKMYEVIPSLPAPLIL